MALFEWNPRYSVHIDEFDNHHKKLLELLRNMHQSMLDGRGRHVVGDILNELKSYTEYHFSAEEQKMEQFQYPKTEEHKKRHQKLISQLNELIDEYKNNEKQITNDTYLFLNQWLTNHIMKDDKQYTNFFKEKGL